jgi:hypothetical protein
MSRKPPAITEDELLQWRIAHARWLASILGTPATTAAMTVNTYAGSRGRVLCARALSRAVAAAVRACVQRHQLLRAALHARPCGSASWRAPAATPHARTAGCALLASGSCCACIAASACTPHTPTAPEHPSTMTLCALNAHRGHCTHAHTPTRAHTRPA